MSEPADDPAEDVIDPAGYTANPDRTQVDGAPDAWDAGPARDEAVDQDVEHDIHDQPWDDVATGGRQGVEDA
jgi:hypothetical protein